MLSKLLIVIVVNITFAFDLEDHADQPEIPEYDFQSRFELQQSRKNQKNPLTIRQHFKERKEHIKKMLMIKPPNNTLNVDGISHFEADGKFPQWEKVRETERDFRRLLAMKGVKYIYKRDVHWRTWREIAEPSGNKTVICYRCENIVNISCTHCHTGGFWAIEEGAPPCPYELYSVIDNEQLCAANYKQFSDDHSNCPSVIKYDDLTSTCDNPIETRWRIFRVYNRSITERSSNVICGERDFCEISTIYAIHPAYVIFRIINSTNNIIYSRVMKEGKKNYACVQDCGIMDPYTSKITTNDKPTIIDLNPRVNKREDAIKHPNNNKIYSGLTLPPISDIKKRIVVMHTRKPNNIKKKLFIHMLKLKSKLPTFRRAGSNNELNLNSDYNNSLNAPTERHQSETSTISHCKKMIEKTLQNDDDDNFYNDIE